MGILGLSRLIADLSPESIKEIELKSLFGRRIAIDASMCIYQFLIAIRSTEYMMTNDQGETTSHLVGLFYRTIRLLEVKLFLKWFHKIILTLFRMASSLYMFLMVKHHN